MTKSVDDIFSWQRKRNDNPLTFGRLVDLEHAICNPYSYTMGCPPVRGDNPRALAS